MTDSTPATAAHRPPMDPLRCIECGQDWPCPEAQAACPAEHGSQCCGFTDKCREALTHAH